MNRKKAKSGLFYKVLLGVVLVLLLIFCYIRFGLLRPWLTRFEASQPRHTGQAVFNEMFSPADWGRVYELAGLESAFYGSREEFARSMEELLEGRELTFVETSAGLSGGRRYIVKAGNDSVAAFTLASDAGDSGEAAWRLNSVELLMNQTEIVFVRALEGQRVLVNGTQLDEDCQVQITKTAAERYLPEGVHGRRTILWQTRTSAIRQAEVVVLDPDGAEVSLAYDKDAGCFIVQETAAEPGGEEQAMLLGAAETYARYMIRDSSTAQLQRYFDSQSQIYQTIRGSEIWISNTTGHSFENETVSEYCRYGEDMFSARVTMDMNVRRRNGTFKHYLADSTFFFHRTGSGWRAFDMTNVDVQEEITDTRLIFMNGQEEAGRLFVSSDQRSFVPPAVIPPAGQRFAGWAVRERSGDSVTMTVRFQPESDGAVALPAGYILEPMTLYAAFESA